MIELNLILVSLFRRYDDFECEYDENVSKLQLFETNQSNIECVRNDQVSFIKKDTQKIRIRILNEKKWSDVELRKKKKYMMKKNREESQSLDIIIVIVKCSRS
jgi:hypothetical protein